MTSGYDTTKETSVFTEISYVWLENHPFIEQFRKFMIDCWFFKINYGNSQSAYVEHYSKRFNSLFSFDVHFGILFAEYEPLLRQFQSEKTIGSSTL